MKKRFISSWFSILMLLFAGCAGNDDIRQIGEGEGVVTVSVKSSSGVMLGSYSRRAYIFSGNDCVAVQHTDPGMPFKRFVLPKEKGYKLTSFIVKGDNYALSQDPIVGISKLTDYITITNMSAEIPYMFLGVSNEVIGQEKTQLDLVVDRVGSLMKAQVHDLSEITSVKNIELTIRELTDQVTIDGKTYTASTSGGKQKTILLKNNGKGLFMNGEEGSVLFPTLNSENMSLEYKVNYLSGESKVFDLRLPIALLPSKQTNLYIPLAELLNGVGAKYTSKYAEWGSPFFVDDLTATSFSIPDFSESYIYKIVKGTTAVGVVCKENIIIDRSSKVSEAQNQRSLQLNIFYPNIKGEINYKNGYVLDNGGSVAWVNGGVVYKAGTATPQQEYVIDHGLIVTEADYIEVGEVLPVILTDERGSETNKYSVVKIANQLWMQESLNATKYTDGNDIPQNSFAGETVAAYGQTDVGSPDALKIRKELGLLYTQSVAMKDEIAPEGWKVANSEDWKTMVDYLGYGAIMSTADPGATWADNSGGAYSIKGICDFVGFSGLKLRGTGAKSPWGGFSNKHNANYYWALTPENGHNFYFYQITVSMEIAFGVGDFFGEKDTAIAIRCVKKIN